MMQDKRKLNEKAEAHVATIMLICVLILVIDSIFCSWFLIQWYGSSTITGISLPNTMQTFSSNQNFQTGQYNSSTFNVGGNAYWTYVPNIGMVLTNLNTKYGILWSWLIFNNIQPDSTGLIVNNYVINNTVDGPYVIPLRWTGGYDQNEIRVDSDGFHIPNYNTPSGVLLMTPIATSDLDFYPYQGADTVVNANIQTAYNNVQNTVTFTFNGNSYSASNLKSDANLFGVFQRYYGGVGSNTLGATVTSINTANSVYINQNAVGIAQVTGFFNTMEQIMLFGIPPVYLPSEINLICIRGPEVGILICIIILVVEMI